MAVAVSIRVEGLNKVLRQLTGLGLDLDDLKDAFSAIASEAADLAAGFAPRRSGRLAGSIRGNRARNKAVIAAGGARVPYASVINFGWPQRHIRASMFLQQADEAMRDRAPQSLADAINDKIRERGLG